MLFGRGYPMGHVINIIGDINAGKTQLVLVTAAYNAIQGQRILLIDVSNGLDFRGRLEIITKMYLKMLTGNNNLKDDELKNAINDVLNRISVIKVFNPWDLLDVLTKLNTEMDNTYDIIVVDCLSSIFIPYMNTSKGSELSSYGQPNQNSKTISNDNISIDSLIATTLIMLRGFCNNDSTVIITNNSINDKHTSRTNQLRDIPDYLFNDMVDFIITLEKNDISDIINLIHIKCILRPPWYQIDERGNRNDLVSGIIDLSSFETYSL
jgi:RecA/RadA recombinase